MTTKKQTKICKCQYIVSVPFLLIFVLCTVKKTLSFLYAFKINVFFTKQDKSGELRAIEMQKGGKYAKTSFY